MNGGRGADNLEGEQGDDALRGGRGDDAFFFRLGFSNPATGNDTVRDFSKGSDNIVFFESGGQDFDDLDISVVGRNTVIDLSDQFGFDEPPGTSTVTVLGVSNLDGTDFVFN